MASRTPSAITSNLTFCTIGQSSTNSNATALSTKSFNAPGVGTPRSEVDPFASESAVRDYLPQPAVWALRRGLAPWNGVAPLKIDWITARGVRPLSESEVREDGGGRISLSPVSWEKPSWHGRLLSDHDPLSPDIAQLPRLANPSIG